MPFPPLWLTRPMMRRTQPPTIMLLMGIWISFTKKPMNPMIANPIAVAMAIFWNSFLSGLVHLLTSRIESFTNCRLGSTNCITWSMFVCLKNKSKNNTLSSILSHIRTYWVIHRGSTVLNSIHKEKSSSKFIKKKVLPSLNLEWFYDIQESTRLKQASTDLTNVVILPGKGSYTH